MQSIANRGMVASVPCNLPESQPCTDESGPNQSQEVCSAETVIPCHGLLGLTGRIQRLPYKIERREGMFSPFRGNTEISSSSPRPTAKLQAPGIAFKVAGQLQGPFP